MQIVPTIKKEFVECKGFRRWCAHSWVKSFGLCPTFHIPYDTMCLKPDLFSCPIFGLQITKRVGNRFCVLN
jgi:hypothetical protein